MAIKRTFNGATIIHPGAFSKIIVENLSGFPLSETGVVGIIGEAVGGEPRVLDILSKERIQDAKARYKSGPIADALELLVNPSGDQRLPNGASKIVVYKVNGGLQSSAVLKNKAGQALINLKSKNWGVDENQLQVSVSPGQTPDKDAELISTIAGPLALAGGETLILKANGVSHTFTNTLSGSVTAAQLTAELNTSARWAPAKPIVASVHATVFVKLVIDTTVIADSKLDEGLLQVDAASTLDTIAGITGEARGEKGSRVLTFKKGTQEEVTIELGAAKQLSVKYIGAGSLAQLDLKSFSGELRLKTAVTGASGEDLDILLRDLDGKNQLTIQDLVEQIDNHPAYEATLLGQNDAYAADQLDCYETLNIKGVAAPLNADAEAIVDYINAFSQFAVAERVANITGEIEIVGTQFFAGAIDGSAANSDWAAAFEALKEERINCVVPLISADKGAATVDSINALASAHAKWGWSTTGKSERHAFVSKAAAKGDLKAASKALNSGYVTFCAQEPEVAGRDGSLKFQPPWAMACILAGLRAGAEVGEPLTYKFINANNVRVKDGSWNPKKDYAEMIEAGVTFVEPVDSGGFRVVVGNTTYGVDGNFVWNRESVVQAAGFVAYDLRLNLEQVFTGTKAKTGTAEAIANFIKARMTSYLEADIIVGDDLNSGLGYREDTLRVIIEGNAAKINISITPVQGIDFILPTIYLADIRQSA